MTGAVVTDIEGTTTSLSFVKEVLFPYSRRHMPDFLRRYGDEPAVRAELAAVHKLAGQTLNTAAVSVLLQQWIDEDRKLTPLKALQGMIWEQGYQRGDYTGHVYEDAQRKLREWHMHGIPLYVFSSGSVPAQRLLFGYSDFGDLTPLFSGYFDTRVGSKRDVESYRRIAETIGHRPGRILFLSDIEEELDAAHGAGMETYHLLRDGAADAGNRHSVARNFDEIALDLR